MLETQNQAVLIQRLTVAPVYPWLCRLHVSPHACWLWPRCCPCHVATLQGLRPSIDVPVLEAQLPHVLLFSEAETGLLGSRLDYRACCRWGFPGSSAGKESACNARDPGLIPGSARSPGEGIGYSLQYSWASLMAQMVKNLPAVWETRVSLGWENTMEEGTATHSSILAWKIPMDRQAWRATVHAVSRVRLYWVTKHSRKLLSLGLGRWLSGAQMRLPPPFGFLAQKNLLFRCIYSPGLWLVILVDCKWKGRLLYFLVCEIMYFVIFQRVLRLIASAFVSLKGHKDCIGINSERVERNPYMEKITFMKIRLVQFTLTYVRESMFCF